MRETSSMENKTVVQVFHFEYSAHLWLLGAKKVSPHIAILAHCLIQTDNWLVYLCESTKKSLYILGFIQEAGKSSY